MMDVLNPACRGDFVQKGIGCDQGARLARAVSRPRGELKPPTVLNVAIDFDRNLVGLAELVLPGHAENLQAADAVVDGVPGVAVTLTATRFTEITR